MRVWIPKRQAMKESCNLTTYNKTIENSMIINVVTKQNTVSSEMKNEK